MSEICADDVVYRISSPQIITTTDLGDGTRLQTASVGVELGRKLLVMARAGNTTAVLDLMAQGSPFTADWLGTSPLHLAAANGHTETCGVLVRAGISRDARTKLDRTPLHLAAYHGHDQVCELLLETGACVNCKDMLQMTPLHWAVERGHEKVVRVLLAGGADPDVISKFRKTPASIAAERGRDDMLKMIEDTLKEREAEQSVSSIQQERINAIEDEEPPIKIQNTNIKRAVHIVQESPKKPQNTEDLRSNRQATKQTITIENSEHAPSEASDNAEQILRAHGITMLPTDTNSTLLTALQSGRTLVLSDAGKLLLKESVPAKVTTPRTSSSMVLKATPLKTPPKPGVKIFTVNNKLQVVSRPARQLSQSDTPQVRYIIPQQGGKLKPIQLKTKPIQTDSENNNTIHTEPRPVKILLNKANMKRLLKGEQVLRSELTTQESSQTTSPIVIRNAATVTTSSGEKQIIRLPEHIASNNSPHYLKAQILAAYTTISDLNSQLEIFKQRLAKYEPVDDL